MVSTQFKKYSSKLDHFLQGFGLKITNIWMKPSFIKNQDTISCTSGSGCSCANSRSTRIIFMASLTASLRLDVGGSGGSNGSGSWRGEVAASTKREEKEGTWSQGVFWKRKEVGFYCYIHFYNVGLYIIFMWLYDDMVYMFIVNIYIWLNIYMHMFA